MEQRAFSVTILSAKDLNKVNLIGKMDVYIIISIKGNKSKQKIKTPVDKDGGTNPTWNFQAEFVVGVDEAAAQHNNHHAIVFKVKCERALGDKDIGEVHVPIRELLQSPEAIDGKKQFVSYQVRKPDGKPKGFINFAYQFGDKVKMAEDVHHSIAYPPPHVVGSSSSYPPTAPAYPPSAPVTTGGGFYAPPPHAQGYPPPPRHPEGGYSEGGYPPPSQVHGVPPPQGGYQYPPPPQYPGYGYPQQPSYGGYPPPPPPGYGYPPPQPGYGHPPPGQKPPKKNGKGGGLGMGAGLLGGALGGLLIGDMITDGGFVDMDFDF